MLSFFLSPHRVLYHVWMMCALLTVISCSQSHPAFDATGTFEAEEVIVSAEASGRLTSLSMSEGMVLTAGQTVGTIDSVQLVLRKQQLHAQIKTLLAKKPDATTQIAVLQQQIQSAEREKERFGRLLAARAVTQKQFDDIQTQSDVLEKQLVALRSSLAITTQGLDAEIPPILAQIAQTEDQIRKCTITNPIAGTVLAQYARAYEFTTTGKPLYKIANITELTLRAYISGAQLTECTLARTVKVFVDDGAKAYRELQGTIVWVADKAEFTPKTIQTKEERANLVYPMKIRVVNDGTLKIGMYAEVRF